MVAFSGYALFSHTFDLACSLHDWTRGAAALLRAEMAWLRIYPRLETGLARRLPTAPGKRHARIVEAHHTGTGCCCAAYVNILCKFWTAIRICISTNGNHIMTKRRDLLS